jgi:hypothetical protein
MFQSERLTIKIAFTIPQWFPPNRLDYRKAHYYDKYHAYAGSFDHSTYHNSAEDNLFNRFKNLKEVCNYHWIEFEYEGSPEHLPKWIERTTDRLNQFFKQYKESKE